MPVFLAFFFLLSLFVRLGKGGVGVGVLVEASHIAVTCDSPLMLGMKRDAGSARSPPCLVCQIRRLQGSPKVTRSSVRIHEVIGIVCLVTFVVTLLNPLPRTSSTDGLEIVQCCQRAIFSCGDIREAKRTAGSYDPTRGNTCAKLGCLSNGMPGSIPVYWERCRKVRCV